MAQRPKTTRHKGALLKGTGLPFYQKPRKTREVPEEEIGSVKDFQRYLHAKGPVLKSLEAARPMLIPEFIASIVQEIGKKSVYRNVFARNPFPPSILALKQKRTLPPASDKVEAAWTSSILALFKPELENFISHRDAFYNAIAQGNYSAAQNTLKSIEEKLGVSLWLLSSQITLLQLSKGTAAQKFFLQNIMRTKGVSGISAYLAYLYSFISEDNVSLAELTREWSRQENFHLSNDTIQYIRYHISPFNYSTVDNPWKCVAHEENSPIVDRFETFIEMSALAYTRAETVEDAFYIRDALAQLADVSDSRIQSLLALFGHPARSNVVPSGIGTFATLTLNSASQVQRDALLDAISSQPESTALLEIAARVGLKSGIPMRLPTGNVISNATIENFESVLGLSENYHTSKFALQKTALVFRKHPIARSLASFLENEDDRIISHTSKEDEGLWAISGPIDDPDQLPILKQLNDETAVLISAGVRNMSPANKLADCVLFPGVDSDKTIAESPIQEVYRSLYQGHLEYNRGRLEAALESYQAFQANVDGFEKKRACRLIYEAAHALDDLQLALSLFNNAYLADTSIHLVFPMDELVRWAKENSGLDEGALNRAISLNIYQQHISTKFDGDLSDAFEDVLEFYEVDRPSQLISKIDEDTANRDLWVYFFREVATIRRLEDRTKLENYEAIEQERLIILSGLIERCPSINEELSDEVIALTRDREVAQLADQFDRSRIYVNELGVKQFVEVELRDSITRYRRLLDSPGLQQQFIDLESELLKILKASEDFSTITLPATERDGLLSAMVGLVTDSFVLNPDHGLKTYLTTRILHGSIEGELRSAFTRQEILFSSTSDAEFDNAWRATLRIDHAEYVQIRAAVMRFSKRVADAFIDLKDKRVRIRSQTTPKGLFDFEPNTSELIELRGEVANLTDANAFADKIIALLWKKVDSSLHRVRQEIEVELRKRVLKEADALRAAISKVSKSSDANKLNDALTNGLTDFQVSLDKVLAWFRRSGNAPVKQFTVETAVGAATRLTNSKFPNTPIAPTIAAGGTIYLRGTAFSPLLDILMNCFQNAIEHSQINGEAPPTTIRCESRTGAAHFTISNDLPLGCDCVELLAAVGAARRGEKPRETRSGRGTGLREIERVLSHEAPSGSSLSATVVDGKFSLSFDLREG